MTIQYKVGLNAPNLREDVRRIQNLLNRALKTFPRIHGAYKPLADDGKCGKLTLEAIKVFQEKIMGFRYPDQVVDPGGKTWKKLNGNVPDVSTLSVKASEWSSSSIQSWLNEQIPQSVIQQYHDVDRRLNILSARPATRLAKLPNQSGSTKDRSVIAFRQGDERWGASKLGFGNGTIHQYGCTMTSLTMAATYLGSANSHWPENMQPSQLTPLVANEILKKAQAFQPGTVNMYVTLGAKALGMEGKDSGVGIRIQQSDLQSIDHCLQKGGLVLAHVDYKKDWIGDHWILISRKNSQGEYQAIDPTYGKHMILYASPDGGIPVQPHVVLYGRNSSWIDKTPENVKRYRVVRYLTLHDAKEKNGG
ncbi:peptidoglycan-binding domain-containing protein [Microbulbifer pacificus]|uniref:peptidoglycan-binding domain-containing protein n=1 Tax=Microbulbifer pacificus TaxID=407164 RepID=UPI000CF3ADA1|nr:peptidoglycan-binding domain-containing protein [Microbulbifer pacificus]